MPSVPPRRTLSTRPTPSHTVHCNEPLPSHIKHVPRGSFPSPRHPVQSLVPVFLQKGQSTKSPRAPEPFTETIGRSTVSRIRPKSPRLLSFADIRTWQKALGAGMRPGVTASGVAKAGVKIMALGNGAGVSTACRFCRRAPQPLRNCIWQIVRLHAYS